MKRFLVAALLVDFTVLTGYALFAGGFSGIAELFTSSNPWTYQLMADFLICLGISVAWMIGDAKKRGVAWKPYVVLTLLTGSIGPLVYIVRHALRSPASQPKAVRSARSQASTPIAA